MPAGDVVKIAEITQPGCNAQGEECDDAAITSLCYSRKAGLFYVERTHKPGFVAEGLSIGKQRDVADPGRFAVTPKQMQKFLKLAGRDKLDKNLAKARRADVQEMRAALGGRGMGFGSRDE